MAAHMTKKDGDVNKDDPNRYKRKQSIANLITAKAKI